MCMRFFIYNNYKLIHEQVYPVLCIYMVRILHHTPYRSHESHHAFNQSLVSNRNFEQ